MNFVLLGFFFTIVLESSSLKSFVNCCGKKSLSKTSELLFLLKDLTLSRKVTVLCLKISPTIMILKSLRHWISDNIHMASSCQHNERKHRERIEVTQPIAWCRIRRVTRNFLEQGSFIRIRALR